MISAASSVPFSKRFDKENPLDTSLPLTPFEFYATCNSGVFDVPAHRHSHIELMIAESDSAVHTINGKEYPVRSETLCLFMPHHVHSLKNPQGSFITAWFVDFDAAFIFSHITDEKIRDKVYRALLNAEPYIICPDRLYSEVRQSCSQHRIPPGDIGRQSC